MTVTQKSKFNRIVHQKNDVASILIFWVKMGWGKGHLAQRGPKHPLKRTRGARGAAPRGVRFPASKFTAAAPRGCAMRCPWDTWSPFWTSPQYEV